MNKKLTKQIEYDLIAANDVIEAVVSMAAKNQEIPKLHKAYTKLHNRLAKHYNRLHNKIYPTGANA